MSEKEREWGDENEEMWGDFRERHRQRQSERGRGI